MGIAVWWIVIGFGVMIAELFLNSFVVVFFGAGAILTGLAIWLGLPTESGLHYLFFVIVSLALLFGLRSHFRRMLKGDVADAGVDEDFVGFEARVIDGFSEQDRGRGRIDFRGAAWQARSAEPTLTAGAVVRITSRDGIVLIVEKV
ncbi:MAG: NfeD family protein [Gammaproteobacteria bacterium]|nr:NfeD family protein [Gammaproteobacteria bacterium]